MAEVLLLRFDAPLMSFGGVLVDNLGPIREWPAASMLAGLLGNALGYDHREAAALGRLQDRLRFAVRQDRPGEEIVDFQTVDLGQTFLQEGWTTWGWPESRAGGSAGTATHIRHRHYWADAACTVALRLDPAAEPPTIAELESAVREPERPLFLGRKACLPAAPLLLGRVEAASLLEALRAAEPLGRGRTPRGDSWNACWPADEGEGDGKSRLLPVTDERDWPNQVHTGRRWIRTGRLRKEVGHESA